MALGDVGQFVGQHARQFLFLVQIHDQPGEYVYVPAGNGKGVERIVQNGGGLEGERLGRNGLYQPGQHVIHILLDLRVFDDGQIGSHHDIEFFSHLLFVFNGHTAEKEGLSGRGAYLRQQKGQQHDQGRPSAGSTVMQHRFS